MQGQKIVVLYSSLACMAPGFPVPNLVSDSNRVLLYPIQPQAGLKQKDLLEVLGLGAIAAPMFAMKVRVDEFTITQVLCVEHCTHRWHSCA